MIELSEVAYSHEAVILAVRDYYTFLTKMYLDPSDIMEPPQCGWPEITRDSMRALGKTDEVIELLRHLPYFDGRSKTSRRGGPRMACADWRLIAVWLTRATSDAEGVKILTEGGNKYCIDPHVVSLTFGVAENPVVFLDTKLGVVYWPECPEVVARGDYNEQINHDPYEGYPEEGWDWRDEHDTAIWMVSGFFRNDEAALPGSGLLPSRSMAS
ncbi:hypothetical protein TI39_contig617g00011 [Zymoseptoria brevis]|uniref:Uncharacterized protein n=1 Tax=Zymoseptoria brevis TaxID=1047168 RepID=A0A0F4GGE9_9PEZI|nr:hypothetical protein TI39_contig617g00011 [Zymoseptoria brevis]